MFGITVLFPEYVIWNRYHASVMFRISYYIQILNIVRLCLPSTPQNPSLTPMLRAPGERSEVCPLHNRILTRIHYPLPWLVS